MLGEEAAGGRDAVPVAAGVPLVRHGRRDVEGELDAGASEHDVEQSLLLDQPGVGGEGM